MSDAVQNLRHKVLAAPLAADLTVRQYLARTGTDDLLVERLENAERRGGTRWRNDETCEVLLEVPGSEVADVLVKVAADHPNPVGLSQDALRRGLDDLKGRRFSAVGMSMSASRLPHIRPADPGGLWGRVGDEPRRDALLTARANAVARVVESLRSIDLGGGKDIDAALTAAPDLAAEVRRWVARRPVTGVEFGDDLGVRVRMSAPPDELWPVLKAGLVRHRFGPPAQDEAGWDRIRRRVLRETVSAVGRAMAIVPDPPAGRAPRIAADWGAGQIDVVGTAQGNPRDQLRTRQAAEADAMAKLRARVDALPLADNTTLGQAAKADPGVELAIRRVLRLTAPTKVTYGPGGAVTVEVSLMLERLTRELNAAR